MNRELLYELLIQFFTIDVDFSIIFNEVNEPTRSEILKFVDFIKSKHSKEEIMKYNLSVEAKKIILTYLDYILKKVEK